MGDELNPHSLKFHFTILISSDKIAILPLAVWMLSFGEVMIYNRMYIRLFSLFFICVVEQEEVRKYRIMYI